MFENSYRLSLGFCGVSFGVSFIIRIGNIYNILKLKRSI